MNHPAHPLVLKIKGSSLDDGPGIRSVVFFKGCPLSCVWCHNPESKSRGVELSFDRNRCIGCDTCLKTCPEGAVSRKNAFYINRDKCTLCFECVQNCPAGALEQAGKEMDIDLILSQIFKDKPFFDASDGGVTLSGGEPLFHIPFLSDLLKRIKAEGIHTLIETSGCFNFASFKNLILPYTDAVYMDIKLIDPVAHKTQCGISNDLILKNFTHLRKAAADGLDFLPRIPLVPGITDTKDNLEGIASFLKENQAEKIQLLPYNPTWVDKLYKIGCSADQVNTHKMKNFMPEEKVDECKAIFSSAGIEVI